MLAEIMAADSGQWTVEVDVDMAHTWHADGAAG